MKHKTKRAAVRVALASIVGVALSGVLASCGSATGSIRDYEEARVLDPGKVAIWNNVDQHPNIVRICTDGIAWATTSRDYQQITRVPEWDRACADVEDVVPQ